METTAPGAGDGIDGRFCALSLSNRPEGEARVTDKTPIILWYRRDLRLADHPALAAASATGRPVIPVFLHDEVVAGLGAAPRFRLGLSVAALGADLDGRGSRLILRQGGALDCLRALVAETGAGAVWWSRLYDPDARARDEGVKAGLKAAGIDARSFAGHLLFEPWEVETGTGGFYRVYTPFWRAVRGRDVAAATAAPQRIAAPDVWPASDRLDDWGMDRAMQRGRDVVAAHAVVGEASARDRLTGFLGAGIADYQKARDLPGVAGTSGLSENLALGEIGPRMVWHAAMEAWHAGRPGAETFLKEIVWREFAWHLVHHTPHITTRNWKPEWDAFPWNTTEDAAVIAWKRGRTGVPFVDAAMRQMYVTGRMHNRGRMIAASYLTKHLMTHWKIGLDWFADCLTDWDPASNAMGWQWAAGSGPDAAPYFRVFNPVSQLEKFDPAHVYPRMWIAEGQARPHETALSYFAAIPKSWGMGPRDAYPLPIVTPDEGRRRALDAYAARGGVALAGVSVAGGTEAGGTGDDVEAG
jgi:deoxyribodipyrimidine photo-lyase